MIGTTPTNNTEQRFKSTVKNFIWTAPTNHNTEIYTIKCTTCQPEKTQTLSNMPTKPQPPGNMQYLGLLWGPHPNHNTDLS